MKCNTVTFTKCLFSCLPGSGHNGYSRQPVLPRFYMLSSLYLMFILFDAEVFRKFSLSLSISEATAPVRTKKVTEMLECYGEAGVEKTHQNFEKYVHMTESEFDKFVLFNIYLSQYV